MNIKQAFGTIIQKKNISQSELARMMNITRVSVSKAIHKSDMRASTLLCYLDKLEYDMVFVPKGKSLPKDSIVIDNNHELIG